MSHSYVTDVETFLSARLPEVKKQAEKDAIVAMLSSASAFVDEYTNRKSEYFKAVSAASVKSIRGTGSHILRLPRHFGNALVEGVPSGSYYENLENGWLYRTDDASVLDEIVINASFDCRSIWVKGKIYNVSAKWGFENVPNDIAEAVAQITLRWWETNAGLLGQINPAGFVVERDLPESARAILDNWRKGEFEI